jgi:Trp operon repressor
MMERMFKPVQDAVWDISTGKMGILGKNGSIFSLTGEGDEAQVTENLFSEFGMAVPAFAQSVPFDQVQLGDLAYRQGGRPGWVVEKNPNSLILLNTDSSEGTIRRNKTITMGMDQSGVMILRNLFNLTGASGQQNFQMLLPMLMAGSKNEEAGSMVEMMLMMSVMQPQQAAAATVTIPEMPKLIQEEIPATATKAEILEINARNQAALVAYQEAVNAWSKLVDAAKNAAPAPAVDPMSQMMQMMLTSKMLGGNGKKNFFDD